MSQANQTRMMTEGVSRQRKSHLRYSPYRVCHRRPWCPFWLV